MGYRKIYQKNLNETRALQMDKEVELLCDDDIRHLPEAVQKYIRFAGCVGKPKVRPITYLVLITLRQ